MSVRRMFVLGVGLALVAELGVGASPAGAERVDPPGRAISWLNIGDSYGAGEGATQATGHCQRSPNAAGPKAATILRRERGWQIAPDVFEVRDDDFLYVLNENPDASDRERMEECVQRCPKQAIAIED